MKQKLFIFDNLLNLSKDKDLIPTLIRYLFWVVYLCYSSAIKPIFLLTFLIYIFSFCNIYIYIYIYIYICYTILKKIFCCIHDLESCAAIDDKSADHQKIKQIIFLVCFFEIFPIYHAFGFLSHLLRPIFSIKSLLKVSSEGFEKDFRMRQRIIELIY